MWGVDNDAGTLGIYLSGPGWFYGWESAGGVEYNASGTRSKTMGFVEVDVAYQIAYWLLYKWKGVVVRGVRDWTPLPVSTSKF